MDALAAIAPTIAVIAAFHDMKQTARAARIGIIIHREDSTEGVNGKMKRVPKTGGNPRQPGAVGQAAIDAAAFVAAGQRDAIAADQLVVLPVILTHAEVEITQTVPSESG